MGSDQRRAYGHDDQEDEEGEPGHGTVVGPEIVPAFGQRAGRPRGDWLGRHRPRQKILP